MVTMLIVAGCVLLILAIIVIACCRAAGNADRAMEDAIDEIIDDGE